MNAHTKIPTELAAIAAVCCIGGGVLLVWIVIGAVLLEHHRYPDAVVQALYTDPSVRPLVICEGIGTLLLAMTALIAGVTIFARANAAGAVLRAALVLAAGSVISEVIIQGWVIVPVLRKLAPSLKSPESLMYDPRLRPSLPIACGIVALAVLYGVGRTLRRPHVHAALTRNRPPA